MMNFENFDLSKLQGAFERVQEMQKEMQDNLNKVAVRGSSGGGAVKVVINGKKELTKIDITPEAAQDPEMLSDLILAALGSAYAEADKQLQGQMPSFMSGLDLNSLANMFKK